MTRLDFPAPFRLGCPFTGPGPEAAARLPGRWKSPFIGNWAARCLLLAVPLVAGAGDVLAANVPWTGLSGSTSNWSDINNWTGAVQADTLQFTGTNRLTNFNDLTGAANTNAAIQFLSAAGAFTLQGNSGTFSGNNTIVNLSTNLQTISLAGLHLTNAAPTVQATAGNLLITSTISSLATNTTLTFSAGAGFGTTLTGSNTYFGVTTVSSGFLRIENGSALGASGTAATVSNGGALQLANTITVSAKPLTINGAGITSTGALRNVSGTNTYASLVTFASAATIGADANTQLNLTGGLAGNFLKTFTGAGTISVSGTIAGNAGLTMAGSGTLTLSASNALSGTATVSAGTLVLADANALANAVLNVGSGAGGTVSIGNVAGLALGGLAGSNNFALTNATSASVDLTIGGGNGTSSYSGVLSGAGSVTKVGTGNLTLGNANTYTGTTAILSGTVSTGSVVVAGGASGLGNASGVVTLGDSATQGALSYTGNSATYLRGFALGAGGGRLDVTTAGQTLTIDTANVTGSGPFTVGGAGDVTVTAALQQTNGLTKVGNGRLTLSAANTYTGTTTVNAGVLNVRNSSGLGTTAAGVTVASGAALELQGGISITGKPLSLAGTGIANGGALRNVSGNNSYGGVITLTAASLIDSDAGTLTIDSTGTITGNFGLTFDGGGDIVLADPFSPATAGQTLTKAGAGTLTLSATNGYTGLTTVSGGTLRLGADNAINGAVTLSGGATLDMATFNESVGAVTLTNGSILGTGTLTSTANYTTTTGTISAVLAGTGFGIAQQASGTTVLTGANTFTGASTIAAGGVLYVQNGNALGSTAAGTTISTAGGALWLAGDIAVGAEPLTIRGTGITNTGAVRNVSGSNSYAGLVTLAVNGTRINSDAGTLTLSNGIAGAFDVIFGGAGDTVVSGTIGIGASIIEKDGTGRLTLSGSSNHADVTTVTAGVLRAQNNFALGTTAAATDVAAGAALELAGGITITGEPLTITGSGVSSTGALRNVSGTNSFTGAITAGGATLITADAGSQLTLSAISGNPAKTFGGAGTIAVTGIIAGNAGMTMAGSGTLTLSAANSITGAFSINSGVVRATSVTGALGGGTLTLNGGLLELANDTGLNFGRATTVSTSGTIFSERLTSGTGVTHTLGTLGISNQSLTLATDATLASGTAGLTFGNVTLSTPGGATFNATAGTLLTLAAVSGNTFGFTVGGAGDTRISGVIGTTTGTLTKTGAGTLTLAAANTYTGLTTIAGGTVTYGVANALGTGPVTLQNGGSLNLATFGDSVGTVTLTNGNIVGSGTLTSTAPFATTSGTISAPLGGTVGLVQGGNGTTVLSAANAFSGTTTIQSGTLSITSVALGAVNQPLGTAARLDLGVAATSSGWLLYTGGSGTMSKNVFALGNGTDTIQNAGTGLLTLSGTLTKNGTVLRLHGGGPGITVTGTIVGSLANSDLAVQFGLTTLSATNTYTGPTFINSSGTLALGISNAIPSNSAVTIGGTFAGGDGGPGVLSMGSFTNSIGSLAFAGSGGTIRMAPTASATSSLVLSATGAVTLDGASSTLDLTGMATGGGLYRLIGGSSLTGTFATVTGLAANYQLRYGTVNANELVAQLRANQATTFTMTTGAVSRALVNTNVTVSGTITNSSPTGASSLALGLASTGLTGSGFTTGNVAPGASVAVSGTLDTGSVVGTQNWTITNTDPDAITTTSTATGSLQVVNQRTFSVAPTTVALGRYLITDSLPTGTTAVTSLGLSATTANASLGSFSSNNGYTLSLTSGSANFAGATASQTAGYTLTGSATLAGLLSGSFSSTVTAELGSIDPVVVNYTANPVNQRTLTTSTSTLSLGFVHAGGSIGSPTLTVTSSGLNASTADATLGSFTGGPSGFTLDLTSGSAAFLGAVSPQSAVYTLSGSTGLLGAISGTFSSSVTAEFGSIPNVTVAVSGDVYSGQSTWATNGGGDWGTFASGFGANWGTNQGSPGLDAAFANVDTATFGSALTGGTATINTNGATISLASLWFTTAAGSYEIFQTGGSGPMTLLAAGTSAAGITVTAGTHAIHSDLVLGSNTVVDVASGAAFTFHNAVSGSATSSLTKTGLGTLFFDGNSTYAGSTEITQGVVSLLSGVTPLGSGTVTVWSGATLDFNSRPISNVLNVLPGGILLNTGSGQLSDVSNLVIFTGTTNGTVNVLAGGTASFESIVGALVTVNNGGVADFTSLSAGTPSVNVLGGGILAVAGTAAGSYTVAGTGTFNGSLTGDLDVATGGVVAFNGGNSPGSTFNVAAGGLATVGSAATLAGQLHVSGSAVIAGGVTANADVLVESGGVVRIVDGATFSQTSLANAGSLIVDRTTALTLPTAISGTGGLQKLGSGVLTLAGTSTFTGPTSLSGGTLLVDGSLDSGVATVANTTLGGSGLIGGILSGAGLVSPGHSPGILTASTFNPTGGLDAAFEFTAFDPNYAVSGTGALNDVLRLTDPSPFGGSALTGGNIVDVYFDVAALAYNDRFQGGFFTTQTPEQLLSAVQNGGFRFWLRTDGAGQRTFNGVNYVPMTYSYSSFSGARVETRQVTVNFGGGDVTGSVTEFIAIPEPSTIALAGVAVLALVGHGAMRRARRHAASRDRSSSNPSRFVP